MRNVLPDKASGIIVHSVVLQFSLLYSTGVSHQSVFYWCVSPVSILLVCFTSQYATGVSHQSVFYWCFSPVSILLVFLTSQDSTGVSHQSVFYWCVSPSSILLVCLTSQCLIYFYYVTLNSSCWAGGYTSLSSPSKTPIRLEEEEPPSPKSDNANSQRKLFSPKTAKGQYL